MRHRLKPKAGKAKLMMPKLPAAQPASTHAPAADLPTTTSRDRRSKENKMSQSKIQDKILRKSSPYIDTEHNSVPNDSKRNLSTFDQVDAL